MQFVEPLIDLDVLGAFALRVREELPGRAQQDPLPRVQETFDAVPDARRVLLQIVPGSVLPRAWCISADERRLVQLQTDRFVFNWRRMSPDDEYPRYTELRPTFERYLAILRECLADVGRTSGTVDLAEITYINEVAWPDASHAEHPALSRGLRLVRDLPADGFLPKPEDTTLQTRFRIPDPGGGGKPVGRLYVSAEPRLRSADFAPIYLLKMTAHIVMPMPDDSAMVRALDLGHEWAVRAFEEIITTDLQAAWQPIEREA